MYKKQFLYVAVAASFFGSNVLAADDYRLAFSKKDDIEVFTEGATSENWCQEDINLRIVGGPDATLEGFTELLPKLGGLFAAQCPKASSLNWRFIDKAEHEVASGISGAAVGWKAQVSVPEVKEVAVTAEPKKQTELTSTVEEIAQPIPEVESKPESESTIEPELAVEESVIEPEPEITPPDLSLASFPVAGWTPPTEEEKKEITKNFSIRKNQDGCGVISQFNFGAQDKYINVVTTGIECNQNGFLHGAGQIQLNRTDGTIIAKAQDIWMVNGLPFIFPVNSLDISSIQFSDNNSYFFSLGSNDQLKNHYFLKTKLRSLQGLGVFDNVSNYTDFNLNVLVGNVDSFKQADQINLQVYQALSQLGLLENNTINDINILFSDNLEKGIVQNNNNDYLYNIKARRPTKYDRTSRNYLASGDWDYDLNRSKNYLFAREQRAEELRVREEQKKQAQLEREKQIKERERIIKQRELARVEEQLLNEYTRLSELNLKDLKVVNEEIHKNIAFGLAQASDYNRMLKGGFLPIRMIVEVSGKKDDDAVVIWPYEMRLLNKSELKKGWYFINSMQTLDPNNMDSKGLPMTLISSDLNKEVIYACKEKGCSDMQDPKLLVQLLHNRPDWDPMVAKEMIETAKEESGY